MAVLNVDQQTFEQTIAEEGLVLVDFWAPWCGPCKMIAPVLEELDKKPGINITIAKVNVDDHGDLAAKYGVMSIPTLKFFKNGQVVDTVVGFKPLEELEKIVQKHA